MLSRSRWLLTLLRGCVVLVLLVEAACSSADKSDGGQGGAGGTTGGSGATAGSSGSGGAGGTGGASFLGSCDTRANTGSSEGQCRDWYGSGNIDLEVSCNGIGGTFSSSTPCPSDTRVGSCTLDPVLGVSAVYNYYSPTYTETSAQQHCTDLGGTWAV
jgi:hypothetical protein